METKAPRTYIDHLAWIVPTAVTVASLIIDHFTLAGSVVAEIWQRILNIWFIWLPLSAYGAFRFVRFVRGLHQTITQSIPARLDTLDQRLTAFETEIRNLVEAEARSRVAGDQILSNQFNNLDARVTAELKTLREDVRAELAQVAQREAHQRGEGINGVQRELEKHFERMNRIEDTTTAKAKQVAELQAKLVPFEKTLPTAELRPAPRGAGLLNMAPHDLKK